MSQLSGIEAFIHCSATVEAHFPIGMDGKAIATCKMCQYYRATANICGLTNEIIYNAYKYVGDVCPFTDDLQNYFLGGTTNVQHE